MSPGEDRILTKLQYGTRMECGRREYDGARRSNYPDTFHQAHPDERAKRDYEYYSALTITSKTKKEEYLGLLSQERKKFTDYGTNYSDPYHAAEKRYYEDNTAGLFPEQHEKLVEPSQQSHEAALSMANSRDRFLSDHPYGYRDRCQRLRHEQWRDRAFDDSLKAQRRFEDHYRYSGDPSSSRRDQYGRRAPRSWT